MSLDYQKHFNLLEVPYHPTPNPRYLYISPTHNVALEKTKWAVTTRNGLAICFGKTGTGKTTVARELIARLGDLPTISYVYIANPSFSTPNKLLRAISNEFQVPQTSKNYMEMLEIFKNFLADQTINQNKTLVLVIDEAQNLKAPLIEMLRQLMNYESNDQKFLQIVLFAQEEFRTRLSHPRYLNFVNRIVMSSTIETLTLEETSAMLKHRWWIASNGKDTFPFTPEAIVKIYAYSKGIPRTQIILAQQALVVASLYGKTAIDTTIVDEVVRDRNLADARIEPGGKARARNRKAHQNDPEEGAEIIMNSAWSKVNENISSGKQTDTRLVQNTAPMQTPPSPVMFPHTDEKRAQSSQQATIQAFKNDQKAKEQEKFTQTKRPYLVPTKFMSYDELLAIHKRQKSERYTTRMTAALEVVVEKFAWEHDMDNYKVVTEAILEYIKKNR